MTDPHANPSRDPANDDSLLGMARQILDKFLQQVDDMLPARVVSYDRATNRAIVMPMIKVLTTDNRQLSRAQVASVPVMQYGGNGAVLSFDVTAGDIGWIKANDRDISLMLQSYRDEAPNTLRKHSFNDALFIPDVMRGVTIAGEDAHNAVLQTLDGSVKVAIWPDRLKLVAGGLSITMGPTQIDVVGAVTFHDAVTMSSTLAVTGAATLSSTLAVTGAATLTGGATISGKDFLAHTHTGVQTGVSNSGGVTP